MKLVKLTSLTLAIAALVQGCANKEKQTENSLTEKNIKGDVKSIVEKEFSVKDYYGEITKLSETPDDITEYYFNPDGNITAIIAPLTKVAYKWKYNTDGKETEKSEYDENGDLIEKTTYQYDLNGNKSYRIVEVKNGQIIDKTSKQYNKDGKSASLTEYNDNGEIRWKYITEYNEIGDEVRSTTYNKTGEKYSSTVYKYNDKGQRTDKINYYPLNVYRTMYKYDSNGFLEESYTASKTTEPTNEDMRLEFRYKRNEKGESLETLKNIAPRNSTPNMKPYYSTSYDDYGNIIRQNRNTEFVNEVITYQYQYDNKKNWTLMVVSKNGVPEYQIERTIVYY